MNFKIVTGIDLHGTLITDEEILMENSYDKLLKNLKDKSLNIFNYICTGNDLGFIKRKIPAEILKYFDGAILETGCVLTRDFEKEEVLVSSTTLARIKKLEQKLKDYQWTEVYKFAHRLSTISIFPKYGYSLEEFYQKVKFEVENVIKADFCRVTRSSVAVDLIPHNYNKLTGLNSLKNHFNEEVYTCAIADSLNDFELLKGADLSCLPYNSHIQIIELLAKEREKVANLTQQNFNRNFYFHSDFKATFGVIDILENLNKLS